MKEAGHGGIRASGAKAISVAGGLARDARYSMGLKAKVALWVVIPTFLIMGASGIWGYYKWSGTAYMSKRGQAASLLEPLGVLSAMYMATDDWVSLDNSLAEVAKASDLPILALVPYDTKGIIPTSSSGRGGNGWMGIRIPPQDFVKRALASSEPIWEQVLDSSGNLVLNASMPAVSGLREGTLVAVFDFEPTRALVRKASMELVAIFLALLFSLVGAVYVGMSGTVVRPLEALSRVVERVRGGELKARAPRFSGDEIGKLASAFNEMTTELEAFTAELEQMVTQRTRQLEQSNALLESTNQKLRTANSQLERISRVDQTTGVFNRRYFDELVEFEARRSLRSGGSWCLFMVDIDHFKRFNDTFGHQAGDLVLEETAATLKKSLRSTDILARYGGEEFAVILLDTSLDQARAVGEKLRQKLQARSFSGLDGRDLGGVTISLGLAQFPEDAASSEELIARADQALYAAKDQGRNRLVAWQSIRDQHSDD